MEKSEQNYLATQPVGKLVAKFAIPGIISLVVNALYNIVDQIFIGQGVGYIGNSATNVVFPITVITLAFALMIGDGGAAFLSLKLGEKDTKSAQKGVGNALMLSIIVGVLFLVLFSALLPQTMSVFGATDAIMPYALEYGGVIVFGLPFVIVGTALNSMIRADGSPKFAMFSMILGAVINTILDPIFIFVFDMGVGGAALATIIGQGASFALSLSYIVKFKTVKITRKTMRLEGKICKKVLGLGISSFITQVAITIVVIVTNNLLASYGAQSQYGAEIPLAVMGIVMKVNQILIGIIVGIGTGAQPILGYNYGAKNYDRVKQTFRLAIVLASVVSAIGFVLFNFFPEGIIGLFGSEDALYNEFAVKAFRLFLMLCIFNGFQTVSGIYFQATGRPVKASLLSLSRQILILVPAAFLLSYLFGVDGVLMSGACADGIAFVLTLVFVVREYRMLTRQAAEEPGLMPEAL
ncbi:MATE family efflux transporter [Christensenellaceae bacterium OttesenSCG-928-K19]|nr:MATE family efflux transporter [Christensenellaceae bacterium OttesenSCG-928-K19]